MGRTYTVSFTAVAVTAAVDLFEIIPTDDKSIEVVGLFLAQSSDVGDAASEILPYRVIRGHATTGSGGTTTTPRPVDPHDSAAAFLAETCNTTVMTGGTPVEIHDGAFNIAVGEALWLPDGCGWKASQSSGGSIVVRLAAAPADSLTISGTLYVAED
jgi:hypothetical protein